MSRRRSKHHSKRSILSSFGRSAPQRLEHRPFRPYLEALEERVMLAASSKLNLFDPTTDQILPSNGTPINSYAAWSMSLEAQVSGTAVSSYSWNLSQAPDATNVSGQNTYNLQFTWAWFSATVNTDLISVTETSQDGSHLTATYDFQVTGTDNPGWTSAPPTSAATWPHVIAPDQLNNQATQSAGPYANVGLVDGSVQTSGLSIFV